MKRINKWKEEVEECILAIKKNERKKMYVEGKKRKKEERERKRAKVKATL